MADDSVFFPQEQKDRCHIQHESFPPIEIKIDLRYCNWPSMEHLVIWDCRNLVSLFRGWGLWTIKITKLIYDGWSLRIANVYQCKSLPFYQIILETQTNDPYYKLIGYGLSLLNILTDISHICHLSTTAQTLDVAILKRQLDTLLYRKVFIRAVDLLTQLTILTNRKRYLFLLEK